MKLYFRAVDPISRSEAVCTEVDTTRSAFGALAGIRPEGIRLPPDGTPLRVAFVGQQTYFELCSQRAPTPVITPQFFEFRSGASARTLAAQLEAFDPHVVVMFRPELIEAGTFAATDALVLGILTEPLPRTGDASHPDLVRRLNDLAAVRSEEFDRIITFDPLIATTAERYAPIWRSFPLPVADEVFGWNPTMPSKPRMLFVGRTTAHREAFLAPLKHVYDLLHIEHGIFGEEFINLAHGGVDIAINVHNENYPSFENRVALHLAAGHLVISEPLSPSHGLEPGIDFIEVETPESMMAMVGQVCALPEASTLMRWRGRMKAEQFRASTVWARVLHDLIADVSTFGGRDRSGRSGFRNR